MSPRRLSSFLIALATLMWSAGAFASGGWEVAVLFLGAREPVDYQKDVDQNLMELAKTTPGAGLRLGLLRERGDQVVRFLPDPKSGELNSWDPLFHEPPVSGIPIAGAFKAWKNERPGKSILNDPETVKAFLADVFRDPTARRLLVIYGHGEGHSGLKVMKMKALRKTLEATLPKRAGPALDILWLNSCFMANIEAAYELRGISPYLIASQEAEFTAGAPFETLQELITENATTESLAVQLGKRYVESYSYLELGSQRRAVYKSSATIAVLSTARLEKLVSQVAAWKKALGPLTDEERSTLEPLVPSYRMDKADLIDFGRFIVATRPRAGLFERAANETKALLETLEIASKAKLMTNPRVALRPPTVNATRLSYGYADWSRGDKEDANVLGKLPSRLKPMLFQKGMNGKEWPSRLVRKILFTTPFSVDLNRFDSVFTDDMGMPVAEAKSIVRHQDYYLREATRADNPLLLSGYTQGIGAAAERYTGLTVADPLRGIPDLDYLDLDFTAQGAFNIDF